LARPELAGFPFGVDAAFALVSLVNLFVAQTGLLELALILLHPVNLFLRVLRSFEPRVVDD